MNKILLVFDGTHFSRQALEFIRQLNEIQLTGLFVPQANYANMRSLSAGGRAEPFFIPLPEEEDKLAVGKNIQEFERICKHNNIDYSVHKDLFDFALPEIKKECRFADLLILCSELFYKETAKEEPNEYVKEILHHSECPVLLLPEEFEFPSTNILAYDGTESSVFAIKQFAYLFPSLLGQETVVVFVNEKVGNSVPDNGYIEELVSRHFNKPVFMNLYYYPQKYFNLWAMGKKGGIIISGAFGGSALSRMFHKSFIKEVIHDHKLPVFIAHR